jgi:hypothetical protein
MVMEALTDFLKAQAPGFIHGVSRIPFAGGHLISTLLTMHRTTEGRSCESQAGVDVRHETVVGNPVDSAGSTEQPEGIGGSHAEVSVRLGSVNHPEGAAA